MPLHNEEGINIKDEEHFKQFKERHYSGHKKCPTALAWSTDGNLLVSAETTIKIWNFNDK
jgi:WD40 repeat protein